MRRTLSDENRLSLRGPVLPGQPMTRLLEAPPRQAASVSDSHTECAVWAALLLVVHASAVAGATAEACRTPKSAWHDGKEEGARGLGVCSSFTAARGCCRWDKTFPGPQARRRQRAARRQKELDAKRATGQQPQPPETAAGRRLVPHVGMHPHERVGRLGLQLPAIRAKGFSELLGLPQGLEVNAHDALLHG